MSIEEMTSLRRRLLRTALLLPLAAALTPRAGASIDPREAAGADAAARPSAAPEETAAEGAPCPQDAEAREPGAEAPKDPPPCGKTAKKRAAVPAGTNAPRPAAHAPAEISAEEVAAGAATTVEMQPKLTGYEKSFPTGQANALGDAPVLNGSVAMPSVQPAGYRNPKRRTGDPLAGNAEPPMPGAAPADGRVRLAQDVTSLGKTGSVYMRSALGDVRVGGYQFEKNAVGNVKGNVAGRGVEFRAINDQRMNVNGQEMNGHLSADKKSGHFTGPDGKEASFAPASGGVVVNGYLFKRD